jgi:predicted DNA-binding transcriptional regulator AlpA
LVVALDLVGVAEIAEMLGVTRQRVNAIVQSHSDFPKPVAELSAGRIWLRKDVETWARQTGRRP